MAPDVAFEVLQTLDGDALFFSIGTDHVFYVTRELRASQTGWTKIDLSSMLSKNHAGAAVAAKSFTLSQNPQTLAFDLALVVTVAGADFLYLSLNNSNKAGAWGSGVKWTMIPFDAAGAKAPNPLTIADVYLLNIPAVDATGSPAFQVCFVDILRSATDPLKLLDRYYIQPRSAPSSAPQWVRQTLAVDLAAGSISSCLGHRTDDYVPGIYTFGTIGNKRELIFTPQYNYFRPAVAPNTALLTLPAGATAVASALNSAGDTNLFVAATAGLYLFTPDNQGNEATASLVVPASNIGSNNILAGVSSLAASTVGSRTVVWGINAQGGLFHVCCSAGSEATTSAWSTPIPLSSGVERFAFYLNTKASNNVVFAHLSGQQLLQLTQDPVTTNWARRNILLPATAVNDMIQYNSFTSHIRITNDNGVPAPNTPVMLTSISPVTVYINDVYYVLTPDVPIKATADFAGTVTVVQETQSITAVNFKITIPGPPSVSASIDPLSKAMQKLSSIKSGDDLSNVQITTATGTRQSLVPTSVQPSDKNAAASAILQLLKVKDTLPVDGSPKTALLAKAAVAPHLLAAVPASKPLPSWSVTCGKNGFNYQEGDAALQRLGIPKPNKSLALMSSSLTTGSFDLGSSIEILGGDLWNYLKQGLQFIESFAVQEFEGFYHFCVKLGNKVYNAILDCVSAVVGAVEFVFNQIKVFFEDLVAWLGYLFAWDDIKRTHKVLKNILKLYARRAITSIDSLETSINNAFISLEDKVNAWAGVKDPGETIGTKQMTSSSVPGSNSPQSNWALHHVKNGTSSADTPYSQPNKTSSALDQVLQDLEGLVTQEGEFIKTTITQIRTQVVDNFSSLTPIQVIQKLIAIISDLVLKSARNLIVKIVDVIKIIATGLLDLLDAPLHIPILSSIYKQISGDDLTILDLICLIGAIPTTIIFKLTGGSTPYPDNPHTKAIISAPDFATLSKVLTNPNPLPSTQKLAFAKVQAAAGGQPVAPTTEAITTAALNFSAYFASGAVAWFAVAKRASPVPSPLTRYLAAGSYLMYVAPNFPSSWPPPTTWEAIMNDVVTLVSIGKTFADNTAYLSSNPKWNDYISPSLESVINIVWFFPPCFQIVANSAPKDSDWLSLASNMSFDLGGTLTLFTSEKVTGVEVAAAVFVVAEALTLGYGVLCCGAGAAVLKGN
ncbi:hypothetical protein MMC30_001149 [Trapelia coarctata]|nr:hypothetical protein [Trapelia coarctata]